MELNSGNQTDNGEIAVPLNPNNVHCPRCGTFVDKLQIDSTRGICVGCVEMMKPKSIQDIEAEDANKE